MAAAARGDARRPEKESLPVPLPEPVVARRADPVVSKRRPPEVQAPVRPPPRLGFRPAPGPGRVTTTARLHAAPPPGRDVDDVLVGEFSLAAPPFPHPVKTVNPVDAIEIDVVLSDPPPPLRLPVVPRPAASAVQAIGRRDVRTGAQSVVAGVAALALSQLRGWP